jgi:hypothetical protein
MERLQAIEALLDVLDTKQTAQDFTEAVEACVEIFLAMKEANEEQRKELEKDLKTTLDATIASLRSYNEKRWAKIQEKADSLKDGPPGPKGERGDPGESIIGPQGEPGKDGSPDTPEQVMEKVNDPDAPLIKMERIEGLEDALKKKTSGGLIVAQARGTVRVYDLSSQLDGVTKTFSLPAFWRILNVDTSSFPNALRPTVDYTSDGNAMTITFTSEIDAASTLATGQTVIVTYAEN